MTDKTELPELLPCRHCGAEALCYSKRVTGSFFVECDDCGVRTPHHVSAEKAIAVWNARAPGAVAEGARFFCSGPEGYFWCDDLGLATMILAEFDKDDEWTVTDTADAAPAPAESKPANEALAVIAAEIVSLPTMAAMASVNGVRCDPTDAVNRLAEAHATLTRLLAAADGLAEAAKRLDHCVENEGHFAVADARAELQHQLNAYQEARDGK